MSDSSLPQSEDPPPPHVVDGWLTAIHKKLDDREKLCRAMAKYANACGLDCDWQFVNKHMLWFLRWYNGAIATGYLMGRTGVKRNVPNIDHWSE